MRSVVANTLAMALTLACGALASMVGGCARDERQVVWDDAFTAALREPAEQRALTMKALARRAPRVTDAGEADFESAMALEELADQRQERPLAAARAWSELTTKGVRRVDRARAHYQLGRIAERVGDLVAAEAIDKALVLHYPDLMPGERALAHLTRRARERGDAAVDALLAWLAAHPGFMDSPLADNALWLAGDEAERRWRRDHTPAMAAAAELLYRRLAKTYRSSALWNDALWQLSLVYHDLGRFEDEIAAIREIQRARVPVSLFGQNEHEYYWKGQLRIARVQWLDLKRPADAAESFWQYREMFPLTNRHDDMLFYAGCARRAAGLSPDADWELLQKDFPDSKYVRRLPSPTDEQCLPPEES